MPERVLTRVIKGNGFTEGLPYSPVKDANGLLNALTKGITEQLRQPATGLGLYLARGDIPQASSYYRSLMRMIYAYQRAAQDNTLKVQLRSGEFIIYPPEYRDDNDQIDPLAREQLLREKLGLLGRTPTP